MFSFTAVHAGKFWQIFSCVLTSLVQVSSAGCSSSSSSITNFVTTNRIYQTFTTTDSITCALKCFDDDICASYNYEYQSFYSSAHICQLSRCGTNGTLVEKIGFWVHQLRPSKVENECNTPETSFHVCKEIALGMESGTIPDSSISASSIYSSGYLPHKARLHLKRVGEPAAWAAKTKTVGEWIQVDLSNVKNITGIATQGSKNESEWVTSYKLKYSNDGASFQDYEAGKIFTGNTDIDTVVKNELKPAINARYIRVYPQTWMKHPSMRMELYGC